MGTGREEIKEKALLLKSNQNALGERLWEGLNRVQGSLGRTLSLLNGFNGC